MSRIRLGWLCLTLAAAAFVWAQVSPKLFRLSCDSASFASTTSAADLVRWFGTDNVTSDTVNLGEGFTARATILFANDPAKRLEILWKDTLRQHLPSTVRVTGESSQWVTPSGITLGTRLRTLEQLNGKAFRVAGFAFDGSGYLSSWSGGKLAASPNDACELKGGVEPVVRDAADRRWYKQVIGDKLFSSAHPAMQALDPRVNRLYLAYRSIPVVKQP